MRALDALADDAAFAEEVAAARAALAAERERFLITAWPQLPEARQGALLELMAGAGGRDAEDWCAQLARMYERAAERHGWECERVSERVGREGGLKRVLLVVRDAGAFGEWVGERGVHRVQHRSRFGGSDRRQTSFARVRVEPYRPDTAHAVELDERDLREEMIRSRGKGGQHVNKTSTAVRLTHLPTGITVRCESRSQADNRAETRRILAERLAERAAAESVSARARAREQAEPVAFAGQVRTYTLMPYRACVDHRLGIRANVDAVLDGDLSAFRAASFAAAARAALGVAEDVQVA